MDGPNSGNIIDEGEWEKKEEAMKTKLWTRQESNPRTFDRQFKRRVLNHHVATSALNALSNKHSINLLKALKNAFPFCDVRN